MMAGDGIERQGSRMAGAEPQRFAGDERSGPAAGHKGREDRARAGAGSHILIVEDDVFIAAQIEAILLSAGLSIIGIASSRRDVLTILARARPNFALMDITLGDDDGIAIACEIKDLYGLRSIFVTALDDALTRKRALKADPLGWVAKPFSDTDLIAALVDFLPGESGGRH